MAKQSATVGELMRKAIEAKKDSDIRILLDNADMFALARRKRERLYAPSNPVRKGAVSDEVTCEPRMVDFYPKLWRGYKIILGCLVGASLIVLICFWYSLGGI